MASSGLSLVGFMDETAALNHLRTTCVPPDPSDVALKAVWQGAQVALGQPTQKAGMPAMTPIPAPQAPHIVTLMQTPWVAQALQTTLQGSTFNLVEIEQLLAFQTTVDLDRSSHHCKGLSNPPTLDELMTLCLPTVIVPEAMQVQPQAQSLLIKARCLNLKMLAQGFFPQPNGPTAAGVIVGLSLPLVHVVRLNGRCYLSNGFHRVVGAKLAGATQVPCIVRDVPDEQSVGIRPDGSTFSSSLLNGQNPPTLAHFTPTRACPVKLRAHSRIIHVSWAEYVAFDE